MPTPSKPIFLLETEGRSHRTTAEKEQRAAAEKEMLTGVHMKEWPQAKQCEEAHKEFARLRKLLQGIGKDDALYQGVINRYCLLKAECTQFEEKREQFGAAVKRLETRFYDGEDRTLSDAEFYKLLANMMNSVIGCDKQLQAKRKMMLDIEKECIMTVASALRSVPKRAVTGDDDDELAQMMREQAARRRAFTGNSG